MVIKGIKTRKAWKAWILRPEEGAGSRCSCGTPVGVALSSVGLGASHLLSLGLIYQMGYGCLDCRIS